MEQTNAAAKRAKRAERAAKAAHARKTVKKAGSFVFSRLVLTCLLLLIEVVWLAVLFNVLTAYANWINGICLLFSIVMCLLLIRQDSTAPEFKISWMVLFMVMPVQGGLLYLMWGDKRPARPLRRKLERAAQDTRPLRVADPAAQTLLESADPRAARTAAYLRDYGPYPVFTNTQVTYYPLGEAMFADMLPALESAEHFIFVEFFIISQGEMWESIHEILRRKAAAGVDVRVIYDDAGCVTGLPVRYWRKLEAEGIHSFSFNPFVPMLNLVMNNRDHRKILVVDGHTAFTGGVNLADEYINKLDRFGHWRDSGVRLHGEAAWSFTTMFLEFWDANRPTSEQPHQLRPGRYHPQPFTPDGLVQPFSDSPVDEESMAKNVYLEMMGQAQKNLYICTPYLILDNDTLTALCLAAKRGVDVRIYTPGIPDKKMIYQLTRSYFLTLIKAGVKIYSYTPGFLHSKTWLCDDRIAAVGSINLDYRSLYLHFECGTLLYGCAALKDIRADFLDIERVSRAVTERDCRTSLLGTMLSAVLRMLAPLC